MSILTESELRAQLRAQMVPDRLIDRAIAEHYRAERRPAVQQGPVLPRNAAKRILVTLKVADKAAHVEGEILPTGGLRLVLPFPPRTKKNHGRAFGIKQSTAYCTFRDSVIAGVLPLLTPLGLPLQPMPYNLAATYYVDKRGERADLIGLHQGLGDALQNAEVICDDYWFRRLDGSSVVFGDPHPRVELTIRPLAP